MHFPSDEEQVRERPVAAGLPSRAAIEPAAAESPLSPREQRGRRWLLLTGAGFALYLFLASVSGGTEWAPKHALVLRDESARTYLSPSCALGRGNLPISSIADAERAGLHADAACASSGGFLGAGQTVLQRNLSFWHLYPKRGSRWRADGSWKW